MTTKTWHIRDIETDESIKTVAITEGMSEQREGLILRGLLRKMDRERFYVDTGDDESDENE